MVKLFKHSFIWRWFLVAYFALKGVRFSPSASVLAPLNQLRFRRGTKVGNNVSIFIADSGLIAINEECWLEGFVELQTGTQITIGKGTTIRRFASIHGSVTIGEGCILAPNVFISSGSHIFNAWPELSIREQEAKYYQLPPNERPQGFEEKRVTIGDDCWLGVNVIVMPGVEIGPGCVIGANSVVTKSIPGFSVAVGMPAKVISQRQRH